MDKRVQFDFEIKFTNGGGLQGQEFRLDIDGDDITDQELAKYIVEDMRLLMVGEVKIVKKEIINEKHKRKPVDNSESNRLFQLTSASVKIGAVYKAAFLWR